MKVLLKTQKANAQLHLRKHKFCREMYLSLT